jgi:hypothetical protein
MARAKKEIVEEVVEPKINVAALTEEITQAEGDGWTGIEWNVLWQARNETLDPRLASRNKINKEKFTYYLRTGRIEKLDWMFEDEQPVKEGLEALW